jgi:UDP-N-acetylglucosamine--N-acetylmuramyl-(pentapeptide) pyrophosphoryl-undecaprenol N-acetylglucosamine transferase
MNQSSKRIILAGGGSGGPVFPLLGVAAELKKLDPNIDFLFVITKNGPEQKMVEHAGFQYKAIPAAKFRRYFSISNITDIFVFIASLFSARKIVKDYKPDVIFSAGGYVAVPIAWMGKMSGAKIVVHQQDARIGLANKLVSPFADVITTAFERTAKEFYSGSGIGSKSIKPAAEWVGNPIRPEFKTSLNPNAKEKFGLNDSLPILLIFGGATGAAQLNEVVWQAAPELIKTHQVVHITGPGKNDGGDIKLPGYHAYEYLPSEEMADLMKLADIVVARAGLSTIAELSALGKISIIVPMPDSHQEDNSAILNDKRAAVVLNKLEFNSEDLPRIVRSLKFNVGRQKLLTDNMKALMPHDSAAKIARIIYEHAK